ncbi:MAG: DUF2608 domain-containing protein [Rickettsiaceae bacterium]|nr:DUF2608 domain-containing protein [Rickettsiaceae bacterium]
MLKSFKLINLLIIIIFYTKICTAEIIIANDISTIEKQLLEADENTLILFDVDQVLITPTDEYNRKISIRKDLYRALEKKYPRQQLKVILSDYYRKRTVKLVNPKIINLLQQLKQRKIPFTALTAWNTGTYGTIEAIENYRFKELNQVSISFIDTSPFPDTNFPEVQGTDGVPMIMQGAILTALVDKAIVLKQALKTSNINPKKIIFIDDRIKYVKSVEKMCAKENIDYVGIHYLEDKLITNKIPDLDEAREKLRFQVLEQEHIWLLDSQLDKRIQSLN